MKQTSSLLASLGAALLTLSLGCNGQIEVLSSGENAGSAGTSGGSAGSGGSAAGNGGSAAGTAGSGISGQAGTAGVGGEVECKSKGGRCQSPDLPCNQGETWGGYDLCGTQDNNSCCLPAEVGGAGGSAGNGGASGGAGAAGASGAGAGGSAGSAGAAGGAGSGGGPVALGCSWYEELVQAQAAALKGPVRLAPGGAKVQTLPAQTDDKPGVDALVKIVDVTDQYVFAVGTAANDAQALVALKLDDKTGDFQEFKYLDGGNINVLQASNPYGMWSSSPENLPYLYYTVPEGNGLSLRRVSRLQPGVIETLATDLAFDAEPFKVMPRGNFPPFNDEFYLASADRIVRIRKGKPTQELTVGWAETLITSFTIEGSSLFYATTNAGTIEGQMHRAEIDESFGFMESVAPVEISQPGEVISFPDSGEAPAIAVVTRDGLRKFYPYVEGLADSQLVFKGEISPPYLRLSHLEYGIHPTAFGYGYFVDIQCGGDVYAPAFLADQGWKIELRASEPGFPFVQNTPWAGPGTFPASALRRHGNKHGIYVIR